MSFYVTLPSNASMDIFPLNKQASFTTKLAEEINFTSDYEVALVEISYSPYFLTELGNIIVTQYFNDFYENNKQSISIPISITEQLSAEEFINLLNESMSKKINFEENLYKYFSYFKRSVDFDLDTRYSLNTQKKLKEDYILELYKTPELDSNYHLIDYEHSAYASDFKNLINEANYDKNLMKWSFTKDQVVALNKKFKLHIFLVTEKFYNLNYFDQELNIKIDEIKTIDISNTAFADFKDFGVDNLNPSSNLKYLFVDLDKKGTYVNFYEIPKFQIEKAISHRKTLVKITQDEKIKVDMLLVTDKLANIFLESNYGVLNRDNLYVMDSYVKTINYAIINTDVIKNQYFGDVSSQILKIIPIKSKTDSEVVTFFDNLHYIPVSKNRINTINIEIHDLNGKLIKFEDKFTFIILKLHFRKINHNI